MNPIAKLVAITATTVIAVMGVFVAVAVAVSPMKSVTTATSQQGKATPISSTVETLDPPATDAETAAFYAELAPQVGDKSGDAKIISVKETSLGCYSYIWSSTPNQTVASCIDVSTEGFNSWVLDYRKTH